MQRVMSCLIVLGLVLDISACDKKERVPLPKTDAGKVEQKSREAVAAAGNVAKTDKNEMKRSVQ